MCVPVRRGQLYSYVNVSQKQIDACVLAIMWPRVFRYKYQQMHIERTHMYTYVRIKRYVFVDICIRCQTHIDMNTRIHTGT